MIFNCLDSKFGQNTCLHAFLIYWGEIFKKFHLDTLHVFITRLQSQQLPYKIVHRYG